MKPRLRELFLAPTALAPTNDPLVRLAAVRHLHRAVDRDQVRPRLEAVLKEDSVGALHTQPPSASVFALHVAVALSQEGSAEGVQWLLRYLRGGSPRHQQLGLIALRNCRQFPLAVLLGSAIAAETLEASYRLPGGLASLTDDQAWDLSRRADRAEAQAVVAALESAIRALTASVRPDRRLALGTVISRPVQKQLIGCRYTGFLIVEHQVGQFTAVPYEMSAVINRDDGGARMTASDFLREPGRRVLVTYDASGHSEAQVVYALPFAASADMDALVAQLAIACDGLSVGVVVHKWESRKGPMYRLVTSAGQTEVGYDNANRVTIGSCSLLHAASSRPFNTRLRLSKERTQEVVTQFVRNTDLERCAILNIWDRGYKVGGQTGQIVDGFKDQVPEEPIAFLETAEAGGHTFVVRMPLAQWTPEDRSSVLSAFFARSTGHFAVVVHVWEARGSTPGSALIIHPKSGRRETRRLTTEAVVAGTPVFWEEAEGKTYVALLKDQLVDSICRRCYGTKYRLCDKCSGAGKGPCSKCSGTGKSTCGHCSGSGKRTINCTICAGTGRYADSGRPCKKCSGIGTFEGDCRTCSRSGRWNCDRCKTTGIGPCDRCDGALVSKCDCRSIEPIVLRPAMTGI